MLLSLFVAATIVIAGIGVTLFVPLPLRIEERLAVGAVTGVLVCSGATLLAFTVIGMGWGTLAIGCGAPLLVGLGAGRRWRTAWTEAGQIPSRLRLPARQRRSLRLPLVISVAGAAVATRILALGYQRRSDGIWAGHLSTWSDWAAHLAYAGSFAYGDNRGLESPIASGSPLRYHVLADFFGSMFTVTGLELTQALVVSAWILALAFTPLLCSFVLRLSGSTWVAMWSVITVTLSSGIGAWYFIQDVRTDGWDIVDALPRTYARDPSLHLWTDNVLGTSLYAQRSTLLGLCAGLAAAVVLLAARPRRSRAGYLFAGCLIGATGIAHAHMLFSALALAGLAWLIERRREWMWFIAPAMLIGVPLTLAILPPTSATRWLVGWMAPQSDQSWVVFWLRNAGVLLPAFALIAVAGLGSRRLRRLSAPLWLWFIVPNLIAFHPGEWNNTKFFLFWQIGGCIVITAFVIGSTRVVVRIVGALMIAGLISAGALDTVRAMQRSSAYPWVDADDVAVAEWLRDHAVRGDVLVYGATNVSAVAALSGVASVSGYPGWTSDLGIEDWSDRLEATSQILSGGPAAADAVERYGVDWVVIGPWERLEHDASDDYWRAHATVAVSAGEVTLYALD